MSGHPGQAKLNELLHWAVEHSPRSDGPSHPVAPRPGSQENAHPPSSALVLAPQQSSQGKCLDTGVLDAILGRTDAIRMREAMDTFADESKPANERCAAGELLEELVQDMDNANDMEVLGFWPRLLKLLETGGGSDSDCQSIQFHACWVCGTAVQNNPKSQIAFLKHDPLPVILELVSNAEEPTQAKALYCLSSTLKHAPPSTEALGAFSACNGWEMLLGCLKGPSMTLRRKTVFLINSLFLEESLDLARLRSTGLLTVLIDSMSPTNGIPTGPNGDLNCQDEDYMEKAIRAISSVILNSTSSPNQSLSPQEKQSIKEVLKENQSDSDKFKATVEGSGIGRSEWQQVLEILSS